MSTHPPLRDALADYLALRRALGFKLANAGRLLGQFVDYLDGHGVDTPTTDHALAWATLPANASTAWRAIRLSVVRGFAAYLHGIDPTVEVLPAGLIRHGPDRATPDRKSTRLNSSHVRISYAVFCLKKKNNHYKQIYISDKKIKK